jgi:DinB superfamily
MAKLFVCFLLYFFAGNTVNLMMQNIIRELERIIQDYTPQLQQLNEDDFSFKTSPLKWSGKEFLGHLIDSAQNNARRFVVAQYEDKPFIVYDQEKWVAAADYQNYPLKDLINLWVLVNKYIVIILKKMREEALNREVQTQEVHSIKWLAEDYNKHLLHHLHQVLHLEPVAYP